MFSRHKGTGRTAQKKGGRCRPPPCCASLKVATDVRRLLRHANCRPTSESLHPNNAVKTEPNSAVSRTRRSCGSCTSDSVRNSGQRPSTNQTDRSRGCPRRKHSCRTALPRTTRSLSTWAPDDRCSWPAALTQTRRRESPNSNCCASCRCRASYLALAGPHVVTARTDATEPTAAAIRRTDGRCSSQAACALSSFAASRFQQSVPQSHSSQRGCLQRRCCPARRCHCWTEAEAH